MQKKKERLKQIEIYSEVLSKISNHEELDCLNSGFPSYPRPLEGMMQDKETSNLYSMVLRPSEQDGYLRSEGSNPIFSVAHKSMARNINNVESELQKALISALTQLNFTTKNIKAELIQKVVTEFKQLDKPNAVAIFGGLLQEAVAKEFNVSVDFSKTAKDEPITQELIENIIFSDEEITPEEYVETLLGLCANDLFTTVPISPFKYLNQAEQWSIATQFLLGLCNLYAVTHNKISLDTNFGEILDNNPQLSLEPAEILTIAYRDDDDIETALINWINVHATEFKLKNSFTTDDLNSIKQDFASRYNQIKDSPHFDEFFLLDTETKGRFVMHQGSICTSFAEFASSPLLDLPEDLTKALEPARNDATGFDVTIPHKNTFEQADVEVDTKDLDNEALQDLYNRIDSYQDPKLKKELKAQLKKERPDFKPQIDVKAFLQCIAYGQQDEAEALLQQDPELALELLKADKIPFTDYSGRTFTCTGYEYAYWAKDSHMQRMLEKYIRADEETRAFILKRVVAIEEPKPTSQAPGLFEHPVPQGLRYTTKDQDRNIIEHKEAHFSLKPLIDALQHYVTEYDNRRAKTAEDWEVLDNIWINEVGGAQRDLPAHLAQEYCHPDRSFEDVKYNKDLLNANNPKNLKRQLTFNNLETSNNDVWFSPGSYLNDSGLGFSFAILRWVWRVRGAGAVAGGAGPRAVDLSAIKAIDEVRTADLTQSRDNLSLPLMNQMSHPGGV